MKKDLENEIKEKAVDSRLSCAAAREIAEDLKLPYSKVGDAANKLGIRIRDCQLGCF
jgi:hypothetical protein